MHLKAATTLVLAVTGLGCSTCDNIVVQTIESGAQRAVIFVRSCDATTSFSTNVSLLSKNEILPNEAGNVLVADDDQGRAPVNTAHALPMAVSFDDPTHLRIALPRTARVFKSESSRGESQVRLEQEQ